MATHVEQLALWGHICAGQATSLLSLQAGQLFSTSIPNYTGQMLTSVGAGRTPSRWLPWRQ